MLLSYQDEWCCCSLNSITLHTKTCSSLCKKNPARFKKRSWSSKKRASSAKYLSEFIIWCLLAAWGWNCSISCIWMQFWSGTWVGWPANSWNAWRPTRTNQHPQVASINIFCLTQTELDDDGITSDVVVFSAEGGGRPNVLRLLQITRKCFDRAHLGAALHHHRWPMADAFLNTESALYNSNYLEIRMIIDHSNFCRFSSENSSDLYFV